LDASRVCAIDATVTARGRFGLVAVTVSSSPSPSSSPPSSSSSAVAPFPVVDEDSNV
jgi:hypothetical protein